MDPTTRRAVLREITCEHDNTLLRGVSARPDVPGPHPAILVLPNAFGFGNQPRAAAVRLAQQGYFALAADLYGDAAYSEDHEVVGAWIRPLLSNPARLRSRLHRWLDVLKGETEVDGLRVAVVGYCFGGLCALELARSGADIRAALSFHGLLAPLMKAQPGAVRAHVAVFTGAKDPNVPREDVEALRQELVEAGAYWQITEFGQAYHAFTDPEAATPERGRAYDLMADEVSWASALAIIDRAVR